MPQPIMAPMPRLDVIPWPVATSQRPSAEPPAMMPKLPSSAPRNQTTTDDVPTRKPIDIMSGELYRPNDMPGTLTPWKKTVGSTAIPSRSHV